MCSTSFVHFTRVFPHRRLTLEVVLIEIEEWRYPGHGAAAGDARQRSSGRRPALAARRTKSIASAPRPIYAACCPPSCRSHFTRANWPKASASNAGSPSEWRTASAKWERSARLANTAGLGSTNRHRQSRVTSASPAVSLVECSFPINHRRFDERSSLISLQDHAVRRVSYALAGTAMPKQ